VLRGIASQGAKIRHWLLMRMCVCVWKMVTVAMASKSGGSRPRGDPISNMRAKGGRVAVQCSMVWRGLRWGMHGAWPPMLAICSDSTNGPGPHVSTHAAGAGATAAAASSSHSGPFNGRQRHVGILIINLKIVVGKMCLHTDKLCGFRGFLRKKRLLTLM
jgi:hypothetical protein